MNLDEVMICDIETIGFLKKLSKMSDLHVFSCAYKNKKGNWCVISTNKEEDIKKIVSNPDNTLVFHSGISFDKPALIKMGWEFNAEIIDTLPISYYLYSELDKHGLENHGEMMGIKKPEISDEEWLGIGDDKKNIIKYYEGQKV